MIVDSISRPTSAFILLGGIYLAVLVLLGDGKCPLSIVNFMEATYLVAAGIIIIWALCSLVDVLSNYIEEELQPSSQVIDRQFIPLIRKSLHAFVIVIGTFTILSSLNVDIRSLLAGFGVAGIAVSLAAQDTLGNFFGSIALIADKPFKVGDWIIVGSKIDGFVEFIGFRSTQIRSWPNTLVTIPNRVLANETIDNWSKMKKRRVSQTIGISLETTPDQIEIIVASIDKMLREHPGVHQDFILVKFTEFNESSLGVFLYYFSKSIQWAEHLTVKQEVNLNVIRILKEAGTKLSFPMRSIYTQTH